ncbi:hypothetical protein RP20_CCG010733 [Aedes albopictus]|nr:hypothetical protein RP20_CCG010731 [Aedes albopictus]KXJ82879.1 hypothetical protein RP20_CCG010733 [Aedes albopictus]
MSPVVRQCFAVVLILAYSSALRFSGKYHSGLLRADNSTDTGTEPDTFYDNSPLCASGGPLTICIGCQTYKVCTGQPTDDTDSKERCPSDKPYCESTSGTCSETADNSIKQCSSGSTDNSTTPTTTFKCTGEGKFPDPFSCDKFYYCNEQGADGVPNDCPPNYSYNVTSQQCTQTAGACQLIDCSSEYVFNEYPTDPQYFYYCKTGASGSQSEIYLFSCGSGAKFDVCSEQCVFECTSEGLFAKASNPNKYYQCYSENGSLKYIERSCPVENQVFDEMVQFCVYPVTK